MDNKKNKSDEEYLQDFLLDIECLDELQPEVKMMIENYIEVIRRDIVEDQHLIDICNRIYNKHRKALDLIFENKTDGKSQISDSIRNALQALCDEGEIIYDKKWNYVFRTENMEKDLLYKI